MSKSQIAHRIAVVAVFLAIFSVPFYLKYGTSDQAYLAARSTFNNTVSPSNSETTWTATAGDGFVSSNAR